LPHADSFFLKPDTEERAKAAKANESFAKKANRFVGGIGGSIFSAFTGAAAKQQQPKGYPSPWDLPEVGEEELETEMAIQRVNGENPAATSRGSKRPASPRKTSSPTKKPASPVKKKVSPRKIPQRDSEDEDTSTDGEDDYVMSGGLH
jgi:hypothetical protein